MNQVRAKFKCTQKVKHDDGGVTVHMIPVSDGSPENKTFNDYTPGGNLQMHIAPEKPAQEFFDEGTEYYLDFTKATAIPEEGDKAGSGE